MKQTAHGPRGGVVPAVPSGRRCLAVWLAATLLCWGAGSLCLQTGLELWRSVGRRGTFEDLVVLAGAAAGAASLAWLWSIASLTVATAARGRVGHSHDLPTGVVRRAVLAMCGVALTVSVAAPSHAAGGAEAADLSGLPYPDRASISAAARTTTAPDDRAVDVVTARPAVATARTPRHTHVVRPGDTLWGIAEATLDGPASVAEVDARWREIHRLNRAVLGDDPHLIHPDQVLTLPTTHEGDRS